MLPAFQVEFNPEKKAVTSPKNHCHYIFTQEAYIECIQWHHLF
jgi:hypothetical protein